MSGHQQLRLTRVLGFEAMVGWWGSHACRDGLWYVYRICVPVSYRGCRSVIVACSWQDHSGCPSCWLGRSRPVFKTLVVRLWALIDRRSQWCLAGVLSQGSSTIWQVFFHQGRWPWRGSDLAEASASHPPLWSGRLIPSVSRVSMANTDLNWSLRSCALDLQLNSSCRPLRRGDIPTLSCFCALKLLQKNFLFPLSRSSSRTLLMYSQCASGMQFLWPPGGCRISPSGLSSIWLFCTISYSCGTCAWHLTRARGGCILSWSSWMEMTSWGLACGYQMLPSFDGCLLFHGMQESQNRRTAISLSACPNSLWTKWTRSWMVSCWLVLEEQCLPGLCRHDQRCPVWSAYSSQGWGYWCRAGQGLYLSW